MKKFLLELGEKSEEEKSSDEYIRDGLLRDPEEGEKIGKAKSQIMKEMDIEPLRSEREKQLT